MSNRPRFRFGRRGRAEWREARPPRALWPALAGPGIAWLLAFFVVPFYAIVSVAAGGVNEFAESTPQWNPLRWNLARVGEEFAAVLPGGDTWNPMRRTILFVTLAVLLCFLIGYPVAYYVARHAGRRKGLLLLLLLAPFWISYLMRMLSWLNLLQEGGYVNDVLAPLPFMDKTNYLEGRAQTLVLGLVYGYIPFLILPLFAALDRIDGRLIEASRDLGIGPIRTFFKVTLPLSRQGMMAAGVITALPMFGDYYTQGLLAPSPKTSMLGNQIEIFLRSGASKQTGAALVLVMSMFLAVLMAYYLWSTNSAAKEVR
jgi:spermidine/putrescine transport system permease protein